MATGEEDRRRLPPPTQAARSFRIDSIWVDEGRLGVLGRRRRPSAASLFRRLDWRGSSRGSGLLELRMKRSGLRLVGHGLRLPRHRLGSKTGEAVLELGAPPRRLLQLHLLLSQPPRDRIFRCAN